MRQCFFRACGARAELANDHQDDQFGARQRADYLARLRQLLRYDNGACHASISELEQKLDPNRFIRIHRSTLLNLDHVQEIHSWFAGGVVVRLKDEKRTELAVARDRVRTLKQRLGY